MIDLIVQCFRSPHIQTTTHLAVMLAIARRCGDENGVCFAKQATLAADTRLHAKSVGRAISELEAMDPPLIRRVKGTVDDRGRRSTDHLFLMIPAVTLPATGPKPGDRAPLSPWSPVSPSMESCAPSPCSTGLPIKRPLEETNEDNKNGASREMENSPIDYAQAVEMIWRSVGEEGRKRSSKKDLDSSLRSAIKRRPKGRGEEAHLRLILTGIRAYLSTDEARKENGAFERGAHRTIVKDRWESFLDGDQPLDPAAMPVDPLIGTDMAPGVQLQRLWAELAAQGMPWNEARGPRPGRPGCRIDPAIQREFGFTPWEGEQPLEVALAAPLALPAPDAPPAPPAPGVEDDDASVLFG